MPIFLVRSPVWFLMLLLKLDIITNTKYPEQNVSFIDLQKERSMHKCCVSFCKRKLLHKNDLINNIGSRGSKQTSRSESDRTAMEDISFRSRRRNTTESLNRKTLMDYSGPLIMEDLDNRSSQDFTNHIRVKRDKQSNESIINLSINRSINLLEDLPRNFGHRNISIRRLEESEFKVKKPYSDYKNQYYVWNGIAVDTSHTRHKRGLLSKNGQRKKRVKGNTRHSKHRAGDATRSKKKHDTRKIFHKHTMKNSNGSGQRNKKTVHRSVRTIDEPQVYSKALKTRESRNSDFYTDIASIVNLTNCKKVGTLIHQRKDILLSIDNKNLDIQRKGNSTMLPLINIKEAKLRARIKQIPKNESFSFVSKNAQTDCSSATYRYTTMSPKDMTIADITANVNIIMSEFLPNFDSKKEKEANKSTARVILKELSYGSNPSSWEVSDPESVLSYHAAFHSVKPNLRRINDNRTSRNTKYNDNNEIFTELSNEDIKLRTKRNHEITKSYSLHDTNRKRSKDFKNVREGTLITKINDGSRMCRKTRDNRAVRSIEQIKQLTEKLIAKVNELQAYTSNDSVIYGKATEKKIEALYTTDSCNSKNANNSVVTKKIPRISSVNSSFKSEITPNIDKRQHLIKNSRQANLLGKRACQMPSSLSRFARGGYRKRRRLRRKWGRWMDWSSCSVTCGKGRQIRWRHCLHECDEVETEMEEKACQLPACPPGKFLGIF